MIVAGEILHSYVNSGRLKKKESHLCGCLSHSFVCEFFVQR